MFFLGCSLLPIVQKARRTGGALEEMHIVTSHGARQCLLCIYKQCRLEKGRVEGADERVGRGDLGFSASPFQFPRSWPTETINEHRIDEIQLGSGKIGVVVNISSSGIMGLNR